MSKLIIKPLTFRQAHDYVNQHHRHHSGTIGCKFCIGVYQNGQLCGVAICGRPVSRGLDDGLTLEINRVCTDGTQNACSKLYGASIRIAREMGYKKVITYILDTEDGASVKASNMKFDGYVRGRAWNCPAREREYKPIQNKQRYIYEC